MGFKCGIIGLPNAGKSTIFNALAAANVPADNYPFCTIDPNTGRVPVPDVRLDRLAEIIAPETVIPAYLDFIDIAGLIKGASKGEGLGNRFLAQIREVDALAVVVRCFEDENVAHPHGEIDPLSDMEVLDAELILKDIETVEKALEKSRNAAKSGDPDTVGRVRVMESVLAILEGGKVLRNEELDHSQAEAVSGLFLLTVKPVLYLANCSDADDPAERRMIEAVREKVRTGNTPVTVVNGKLEAELLELDAEERAEFIGDPGLEGSALDRIIKAGYDLLDLITFFTTNYKELRAWTVEDGTRAPAAAGKIHTDFERGFIRAEVMKYEDIDRIGSVKDLKEKGLLHVEGKDYRIKDGDLVLFKFNV